MHLLRTWIPTFLTSGIPTYLSSALFLLAGVAHAAIGDLQGVRCDTLADGQEFCAVQLAPGTWIQGPSDAWAPHEDMNGFEFDDGEQRLSARFCDPREAPPENLLTGVCYDTIRGTQQFQVPRIGFLGSVVTPEAPLVSVGLDSGENLANDETLELAPDLVAMLDDADKYLLMLKDTAGFTASVPGLDFLELSAGGDRTAVVVGMDELFLYFEGQLPGLPKQPEKDDDSESSDSSSDSSASDSGDDGGDGSSDTGAAGSESSNDPNGEGTQEDATAEPEEEREQEDEEGGPDAVAIKIDGGIPFTPLRTRGVEGDMQGFEGHVYVKGPVPVAPGFEIDGTLVFDVDPDRDGDHPFQADFYESVDLRIGANDPG